MNVLSDDPVESAFEVLTQNLKDCVFQESQQWKNDMKLLKKRVETTRNVCNRIKFDPINQGALQHINVAEELLKTNEDTKKIVQVKRTCKTIIEFVEFKRVQLRALANKCKDIFATSRLLQEIAMPTANGAAQNEAAQKECVDEIFNVVQSNDQNEFLRLLRRFYPKHPPAALPPLPITRGQKYQDFLTMLRECSVSITDLNTYADQINTLFEEAKEKQMNTAPELMQQLYDHAALNVIETTPHYKNLLFTLVRVKEHAPPLKKDKKTALLIRFDNFTLLKTCFEKLTGDTDDAPSSAGSSAACATIDVSIYAQPCTVKTYMFACKGAGSLPEHELLPQTLNYFLVNSFKYSATEIRAIQLCIRNQLDNVQFYEHDTAFMPYQLLVCHMALLAVLEEIIALLSL